ncbi:Plant organelle RNA recognition domain [Dillenia turbinata]|uniref:Plant organelle RNA recognition domain n=1 Tax=Dillenia turbinata TaxID=194707 RepID=A0AAN8W3K3_9MAGN
MAFPYISPYKDVLSLDQSSPEMEKRTVGVVHELSSLSLFKRIPVPIVGKFCVDYRFSNAFPKTFSGHSGIFYVSLKGGLKTAMESWYKTQMKHAGKGEQDDERAMGDHISVTKLSGLSVDLESFPVVHLCNISNAALS